MTDPHNAVTSPLNSTSTELASRRTGMAFQRTRLAADRTLMAVIRTSLSLLSFGFTIHKVFDQLKENGVIAHAASGRNFGLSLVLIGAFVLLMGIVYHAWFMIALRRERGGMRDAGMLHAESPFPPSMTLVTALLLLALGVATAVSMIYRVGPFT
ncbi:YidH family protein [Lysobacter arvi]|uniref:DUF202 domain-containing protein n=1 Tax=Lysobacter arvi TaxID=3038776 RepID=A0ABU1CA72_9GAMM|nr:DUF202 domain-containing protein [Lysobacter arvi]MDR0182066.1 DUF202 domain-containing protein [Lysobacter arvi]